MISRFLYWKAGTGLPPAQEVVGVARVVVASKAGQLIGEIEPYFESVPWRLNKVSKINMAMARTDDKATKDFLRFGNRLLIEFDNGLPNWVGVFDPNRHWRPGGVIEFEAYSAEHIFGWRQTGRERLFEEGAPVGYVFQALIEEANAERSMGIGVGSVWMGGAAFTLELHYANLLETIEQELVDGELSTYDFDVSGVVEDGRIVMSANFYERKGEDKSNKVALLEGHNIADVELIEQGPIVNAWDVAGRGSTWDDSRPVAHVEDVTSIAEYDFRQGFEGSETDEASTTAEVAANRLAEYENPHNRLLLEAVDLAPAKFAAYGVGDTVQVVLENYGFDGYNHGVRVLTREYDAISGRCMLVPEEA